MASGARCSVCGGAGWIVDCNITQTPRMLELIACIVPDCEASGCEVQSIVFKGIQFRAVTTHPADSWVMSLSAGRLE